MTMQLYLCAVEGHTRQYLRMNHHYIQAQLIIVSANNKRLRKRKKNIVGITQSKKRKVSPNDEPNDVLNPISNNNSFRSTRQRQRTKLDCHRY